MSPDELDPEHHIPEGLSLLLGKVIRLLVAPDEFGEVLKPDFRAEVPIQVDQRNQQVTDVALHRESQ